MTFNADEYYKKTGFDMSLVFGSRLSWAELGRLQDRIEVLEQREVQYQKFIRAGLNRQDMDKFMIDMAYGDWRQR